MEREAEEERQQAQRAKDRERQNVWSFQGNSEESSERQICMAIVEMMLDVLATAGRVLL